MATFDLTTVDAEDTTTVQLVHPATGEEIGVSITIFGQDSEVYKSEQRKAETRFSEYSRRNRGKLMPAEDRERMDKAKVVACIKSIDGLERNGQPVSPAEAMDVAWIFEQVTAAMFDRSLFIKG